MNAYCARLGLCLLVCVAGCTWASTPAVSDGTAEGDLVDNPSIAVLPDRVGDDLAQSLARWVRWPDDEYIRAHVARRDRSAEFPAAYLQTEHGRGRKVHPGAVSPEIACARRHGVEGGTSA